MIFSFLGLVAKDVEVKSFHSVASEFFLFEVGVYGIPQFIVYDIDICVVLFVIKVKMRERVDVEEHLVG